MNVPLRRSTLCAALMAAVTLTALIAAPATSVVRTSTGVRCTIVGTAAADVLVGTGRADVICGRGGNDVVRAGKGNDIVDGGPGADRLRGDEGHDTLLGGTGNDVVLGMNGDDIIRAEAGNDRVTASAGNDRVTGGDGNDILLGDDGSDALAGEAGDDDIDGSNADDRLTGGPGNDVLRSGSGDDSVDGGGGDNLCIVDGRDRRVRCRYDEQPPVVVKVSFSPATVDVTKASAPVTVRIHATDVAGVSTISPGYLEAGNNTTALFFGGFSLVSGTDRDGWWQARVTIPRYTRPGNLWLGAVGIHDDRGNVASVSADVPLQVIDTDPDTQAPQLSVVSVTPSVADVRTQDRKVKVTLHAVDMKAGVARLDICLSHPTTPTSSFPRPYYPAFACVEEAPRISGTAYDGTWTATLTVPKGAVGATYNVLATVTDRVTNDARWHGPEAHEAWNSANWCCIDEFQFPGDAGRIDVVGTIRDTTAAWTDSVMVSKSQLTTQAGPDTVHVRVRAQDVAGAGDGVTGVRAMLVPAGSLPSDPQVEAFDFELRSGTVSYGWWEGDIVAPQGLPPGTYHLVARVEDRAHVVGFTDPGASFVDGGDYKGLAGVPTLTVVEEGP